MYCIEYFLKPLFEFVMAFESNSAYLAYLFRLFSGIFVVVTKPKLIDNQNGFVTLKRAEHWILFTMLRWYLFTIPFYLRIEVKWSEAKWSIVTWFTLSIVDNLYVIPVWSALHDLFHFNRLEFVVRHLTISNGKSIKVCLWIIYCPSNYLRSLFVFFSTKIR